MNLHGLQTSSLGILDAVDNSLLRLRGSDLRRRLLRFGLRLPQLLAVELERIDVAERGALQRSSEGSVLDLLSVNIPSRI